MVPDGNLIDKLDEEIGEIQGKIFEIERQLDRLDGLHDIVDTQLLKYSTSVVNLITRVEDLQHTLNIESNIRSTQDESIKNFCEKFAAISFKTASLIKTTHTDLVEQQGYFTIKKKNQISRHKRHALNKLKKAAREAKGEVWLPLEEFRRIIELRKSKEKIAKFQASTLDEKIEILRQSLCVHQNNPNSCELCKSDASTSQPPVQRCEHGLALGNCRRCFKVWKKTYKIPKKIDVEKQQKISKLKIVENYLKSLKNCKVYVEKIDQ